VCDQDAGVEDENGHSESTWAIASAGIVPISTMSVTRPDWKRSRRRSSSVLGQQCPQTLAPDPFCKRIVGQRREVAAGRKGSRRAEDIVIHSYRDLDRHDD
jgi:hypothetical protein